MFLRNKLRIILSVLFVSAIIAAMPVADAVAGKYGGKNGAAQHITLGAGAFDVLDDSVALFSLEYRGDYLWEGLRPVGGLSIDVDGGVYGYAGGNWDLLLSDSWVLVPNFVIGAYGEGDSKDLGGALEFRSGIELDYIFANDHRLGLTFNHISNASIYDKNPGAESLMLLYSLPVDIF